MVRRRRQPSNQRGVSRIGCLVFVLVVVAVAYFGVPLAALYIRYYRFENEMQTQARFAPSIDDDTIRRRLWRKIDELGLPDDARRLRIRRVARPREIRISTSWNETIALPFISRVITLEPEVRERM